jgi:hypothetical protein
MYELVEKDNVLAQLNSGALMYVVDIPTQRVMECANMTLSAVKSFIDKPEAMFFKVVANE